MNLREALQIVNAPHGTDDPLWVYLACGFQPTNLAIFLAAHLRERFSGRPITIREGVYGDLLGNIDRALTDSVDSVAVVVEWSDLDPRLGLRGGAQWTPETLKDICETVRERAARLSRAVDRAAQTLRVAVSMPTAPMILVSHTHPTQASITELDLLVCIHSLAREIAGIPNVAVVNPFSLHQLSPFSSRLHVNSELSFGHPYSRPHASAVAEVVAQVLYPAPPKKGLITDLDDTLWRGSVGEVGVDGVTWDLDSGSRMHGLYQQQLAALAASGVFIGVASKNDATIVSKTFQRKDLLCDPNGMFPAEVHWEPKAESISRILDTWNIGEDSAVFIDDSPMELDLVKSQFPSLETILFPTHDNQKILELLHTLQHLFGRATVNDEDLIRVNSMRTNSLEKDVAAEKLDLDAYLSRQKAQLTCRFKNDPNDARAFELVNKTNQFNLNGRRYTLGEWRSLLESHGGFLLTASYTDRFGPLGKIAVIAGRIMEQRVEVDTWVMSCRAFGRRIEYACLDALFSEFDLEHVCLHCQQTQRNGPLFEFLDGLCGKVVTGLVEITRAQFEAVRPAVCFERLEITNE